MIIDHKNKFIFIHTFRTGGSSIENAFGGSTRDYDMHIQLEKIPDYNEYFSFGFVRNPWDRLVSSYMYLTIRNKFKGTWDDYVKEFTVPPKNTSKKYAQYDMLKNCNFVGRFEYLQKDLDLICDIIGINRKTLPHVWKTDHKHYAQMFNPEQIDIIHKASFGDIDHFGFDFKSSATRNFGRVK